MTAVECARQAVFIVRWSDMDRWVVPAFALMGGQMPGGWTNTKIRYLVSLVSDRVQVQPEEDYKMAGVRWYGEGVFHRETVRGEKMSAKYVTKLVPGALVYNRLFAWKASFAVVPGKMSDCFVSNEFPQFICNRDQLLPEYLYLWATSDHVIRAVLAASTGSAAVSRNRFREEFFLDFDCTLPPLPVQQAIVAAWEQTKAEVAELNRQIQEMEERIEADFLAELGLTKPKRAALPKAFGVHWKDLERWSVMFNQLAGVSTILTRGRFTAVSLYECLIGTANGFSIKPVNRKTNYRILKLNSLKSAGLDLDETKYVKVSPKTAERFQLHRGDLLICRSVGSFAHVAKCALVEDDHPDVLFPDIIIRARFNDRIIPEYAREVIQSSVGRAWFQQNARTAVGMWKIGGSDIASFPMPLPPLPIQEELVIKVKAQRQEIASLKAEAERKASKSKADVEAMILGIKPVPGVA